MMCAQRIDSYVPAFKLLCTTFNIFMHKVIGPFIDQSLEMNVARVVGMGMLKAYENVALVMGMVRITQKLFPTTFNG